MRPEILNPLFAAATSLSGVGPRVAEALEQIGVRRVADLLWHLPTGIIDRRYATTIADAEPGRIATITVTIGRHKPGYGRRQPYKVVASDPTGSMSLVFFNARPDYLNKMLPEGQVRVVSGRLERFGKETQMVHPDRIGTADEIAGLRAIEPVYRLTEGLSLKVLAKAVGGALNRAPELPEWADPAFAAAQVWTSWRISLLAAHGPGDEAALDPATPSRRRLAYDELLANQLALSLVRRQMRQRKGRAVRGDGRLKDRVRSALPFRLTASQDQAISEIVADMGAENRMLRLLQGDVGSGKTLVALFAMLNAVEAGAQAALMAPTDVLVRQHLATIEPLAKAAGIEVVALTGRDKGQKREAALAALADGTASLAIGTHALFQEGVAFHDLGLAVIDEQHRFGVHERLMLAGKGKGTDVLVMTATPIPRSLLLTAYGDMDASRLTEKPAGRKPIDTRVMPLKRLDELIEAVRRSISTRAKVFWVCPLIEESEEVDAAAAEERYQHLAAIFGERVGLVHGRIKAAERDRVMAAFKDGNVDILVATTVIEVGVDVPDATLMVVEHAERFGLAQLHQLRGRVGRGEANSTCVLIYGEPLTQTARARLKILRETDDGFRIAEEDLRLRGAGELLGTRQSGLPEFRMADLAHHADLLQTARADSKLMLDRDPELKGARGQALRVLLYLFDRDVAVRYLASG
ncbi:MAG: ATP-dependent DNA helicase RecG [Rhodospirillales bacterium]|nr:ATP-dependent DNA helicase RecG [Rhodospirillales bacterium]